MPGRQLTQSENALQQIVGLFSELLSELAEAGLTCTYRDVFCFCELETINYLVLRYLTLAHYHTRSGQRSGCMTGKFSFPIRGRGSLEEIQFVVLLHNGARG